MTAPDLSEVRIVPYPPVRGRKLILVGGGRFGVIEMQGVGGRGNYYYFQQAGNEGAAIERANKNSKRGSQVRVYGDDAARRHAGISRYDSKAEEFPSIEERLLIEARKLIEEGLLISESAYQERQRKALEAWRRHVAKSKEKEEAAFYARAAEAIEKGGLPPANHAALVEQVVFAMRWAQTQ